MLVDTSAGFFKATANRQGLADAVDLAAMEQALSGPPPDPLFKALDGHAFPAQDVYDADTFQREVTAWSSDHGGQDVSFTFKKTAIPNEDAVTSELRRQLLTYKHVSDVTFTGP